MSNSPWPAPGVLAPHPLSLGDVLSAAFSLYGRRFGQLVVIALIAALVGLGAAVAAVVLIGVGAVGLMRTATDSVPELDGTIVGLLVAGVLLVLVLSMLAALVQIKCEGMIALAGRDMEDGRASTVGDLWRRTRGMAGRALVLVLLLALVVFVVSALIGAIALWMSSAGESGTSVGVLALTMIALVLAMLYLQTRLAFVLQTLAIEGAGPLAALGRSWRTTHGAFWRIFGYLLVANLLVGAVGGVFAGAGQALLVPGVAGMDAADSPSAVLAQLVTLLPLLLLSTLGSQLVSLLSSPFLVLFTTVLYIDQRRRLGLEALMGGGPQAWGPVGPLGGPAGPGPYAGGPAGPSVTEP